MEASQRVSSPMDDNMDNSTNENPHVPENVKVLNKPVSVNIDCVINLINSKELLMKGRPGSKIILLSSPEQTFSCLTKLKTLSLTSIKSFPKNFFMALRTIITNLEILQIGDCDSLPDDFIEFSKKLTNLTYLRLENCYGRWEKFSKENFDVIQSMKHLKKLELINIEFSNNVKQQLEKCDGITALLIIPNYASPAAITNCYILDCLEKLSKTLTHLVWGLRIELLGITDMFIKRYQENQQHVAHNIDFSDTTGPFNNIPILKYRKQNRQPVDLETPDIISVPSLQAWLDSMLVNAKTKVIKIPYSATTRVFLSGLFDDF